MSRPFGEFIERVMTELEQPGVGGELARYFADHADLKDRFTGRLFERHASTTDPDRFEPADLLAVEALSVQVPPEAAALLTLSSVTEFDLLLRAIPKGVAMWEVSQEVLAPGSAADRLHEALTSLPGIGWVTAGKLIAAKRPALVPILDEKVRALVEPPEGGFWVAMKALVDHGERRKRIESVLAPAPAHVTLLRRIDVALWMAATTSRASSE